MQTGERLITVAVPVYNMQSCLKACVDSILAQTWQNLDVLLIDDGSEDASGSMCDAYAVQDARVRVIHQSNQGLAQTRNVAVENAKGEYLTFVDADDTVEPACVETLHALCVRYDAQMSACNHWIHRGGGKKRCFEKVQQEVLLSAEEAARNALLHGPADVSSWGKLYSMELLKQVAYPQGRLYEDTFTYGDLLLKAGKIAFTPKPLYHYIIRGDSISQGSYSESKMDYLDAVEHLTGELEAAFPSLHTACRCRKAHAAMSVRRYLVDCPQQLQTVRRKLDAIIRRHALPVLLSRSVPLRNRAAAFASLLGPGAYDAMWKFYDRKRNACGRESE